MGLTQFLAEDGVISTLVVEIGGVGERTGGDGDASDCYSGRSLHGCSCESGWQVTGDHVSTTLRSDRRIEARSGNWPPPRKPPQPATTMSGAQRPTEQDLEEAFVKITFQDEREDQNKDPLYPSWTHQSRYYRSNCSFPCSLSYPASAPWSEPLVYA